MKKTKRLLTALLCFALALCLGGEIILSAFSVSAAETPQTVDLDTTDPLDDLEGSVVLGKPFDPNLYYYDEEGEPCLLSFLEYGFGLKGASDEDFNLYFYVYNPKVLSFLDSNHRRSVAHVVYVPNGKNIELPLDLVQVTEKSGYEGLICKYKVNFGKNTTLKSDMLKTLREKTPSKRIYSIVSMNLELDSGNLFLPVGDKYIYTGFMRGYGPITSVESSLACEMTQTEILELDVYSTYYRAPYLNNALDQAEGKKLIDAQDALHSVYFSVPNAIIKEYGKMTRVKGSYRDALTAPALIVGSQDVYNKVLPFVGKYIGGEEYNETLQFRFYSDYERNVSIGDKNYVDYAGYAYNYVYDWSRFNSLIALKKIDTLHLLFPTPIFGDNAADSLKPLVSSETLKNYVTVDKDYGDGSVFRSASGAFYATKYFENIASIDTYFDISSDDPNSADDVFDLVGQQVTQSWWSKLGFGNDVFYVEDFAPDDLKGIQPVSDKDFTGNVTTTCQALCISEADYQHFYDTYQEAKKNDKTLYLLRYRVSDYYAEETTVIYGNLINSSKEDTNAVICQQHCDLGFQIIECHFTKDGIVTVIPVAMKPIDVFHDFTGAVETTNDINWSDLWEFLKLLLGLFVVVIVFVALSWAMPFVRPIFKVIGKWIAVVLKVAWKVIIFAPKKIWRFFKRE